MEVLLISEKTLKEESLLNDNIDGKYILSTIQTTQEIELEAILGTVLYNKIIDLVSTGEISLPAFADYKLLLDRYITKYLVHQVMANLQIAINYKMSNSGVYGNDDDKKSRLDYANAKSLKNQYDHYASSYAQKMTNFLVRNISKYPEYTKCENYQYSENPRLCSIYLENINTPIRTYKYK